MVIVLIMNISQYGLSLVVLINNLHENCGNCPKEDWERPEHFTNHPQYKDVLIGDMV